MRTSCEAGETGWSRDEVLAGDGDRHLGHQRTRARCLDSCLRRLPAVTGKPLGTNGDSLRTVDLGASQPQKYVALDSQAIARELLMPMTFGVDASLDRDSVLAMWCCDLGLRLPSCARWC